MKTIIYNADNGVFSSYFKHAEVYTDITAFSAVDFEGYGMVAMHGRTDSGLKRLPYDLVEKLWRFVESGGLLYGELIACEDFPSSRLFGFRQEFPLTYRRMEKWKMTQSDADNLLELNGPFQTGFAISDEVLLETGIFTETHRSEAVGDYPAFTVKRHGKGTVLYSAFSLFTNENSWSLRPRHLWEDFISRLNRDYGFQAERHRPDIVLKTQRIEDAVDRSIKWYGHSGIMADPSGKSGVYENIHSFKREVSEDIRPDCNAQTALLFWLYGNARGSTAAKQTAGNILGYLMESGMQEEGNSEAAGFWKWFRFPGQVDQIFTDDNGWTAYVFLYMYRQTGIEEYRRRGLMTAEALLETQNSNGLRPEVLSGSMLKEKGRAFASASGIENRNPHFQSIVHAAYIQAYLITKEERYLQTALKGTLYLLELDEKGKLEWMYSKTAAYSRFMLGLSHVYAAAKHPEVKAGLERVFSYLKSCVNTYGGVEEKDNPLPGRYGKEDTGVFVGDGEGITDQLYTNNFLLMNIWEAWKATGEQTYLDFYKKLADYLTGIQIHSEDKRVDGGWMRAFHAEKKEYFGNNGDTGWGPYCIESGWTNGILTAGLLLGGLDCSLLDEGVKRA